MAILAESMDVRERAGLDFAPLAKDAIIAYEGAIIALNMSTNEGEPAADAANLMVIGRNEKYVDNTDDGERLRVRAGVFRWNNSATNPVAAGAKIGYVEDDNTISSDPGDNSVVVPVIEVDDDGVWVDTRRAAVLAVMGANPVAANVVDPAACAGLTAVNPAALTYADPVALTYADPAVLTYADPAALTSPAAGTGSGADATTFSGAECDALRADLAAIRAALLDAGVDLGVLRTPILAAGADLGVLRTPILAAGADLGVLRAPILANIADAAAEKTAIDANNAAIAAGHAALQAAGLMAGA